MRTTTSDIQAKTSTTVEDFLQKLGFDERDIQMYLCLTEIGLQPASVVARTCNLDRVTTYKHLKKMTERGFVKTYFRNGIQHFAVESFESIENHLKEHVDRYANLLEDYPLVAQLLESQKAEDNLVPKLQVFEGEAGIKSFFRDMLYVIKQDNLKQIRMLTSNTFEERLGDTKLNKFVDEFFAEIKENKIDFEVLEATGSLIPERIKKTAQSEFHPKHLPAARGTTNIFLVGDTVYLACYRHTQIGLKITQAEVSQIFHFIFDFIDKNCDG